MQLTKVDYIIVGLGIAGIWLSHELIRRNKVVLVIDQGIDQTSSKKAAGLYNPITGRKMVKTWKADDLFKKLEETYRKLEVLTNQTFIHPKPIYRPFLTIEDQNDWQGRKGDPSLDDYVQSIEMHSQKIKNIHDPFGGIMIKRSGYVDLPGLIFAYKKYLTSKGIYQQELFDLSAMVNSEKAVTYKNWSAKKIIFCGGPYISKLWADLPFKPVRGDLIDIECDLSQEYVINQGVFIIPKKGFFTVGSTYDHDNLSFNPLPSGIENIEKRLSKIFLGNYRMWDSRAGMRPSTHDRRPYIGFHKKIRTLGIFNGFGTKGVSLTPYFANHFADVLEEKDELQKEVNVERVS